MIDKAAAELNAIKEAKPGSIVRLCQFHAIQAISDFREEEQDDVSRKQRAGPSDKEEKVKKKVNNKLKKANIRIPSVLKEQIIQHFRALQRCPDATQSAEYIQNFFRSVKQSFDNHAATLTNPHQRTLESLQDSFASVKSYFQKQWFTPAWLETIMDFGLPEGVTRDGKNTNNFVESAFKTVTSKFLYHACNHRIDNLCFAIFEFFHHYEVHPRGTARETSEAKAIQKRRKWALSYWEHGGIECVNVEDAASDDMMRRYKVTSLQNTDGSLKEYHLQHSTRRTLICDCKYFLITGKECQHAFAVTLFRHLGSYAEYCYQLQQLDIQENDGGWRHETPDTSSSGSETDSYPTLEDGIVKDNCSENSGGRSNASSTPTHTKPLPGSLEYHNRIANILLGQINVTATTTTSNLECTLKVSSSQPGSMHVPGDSLSDLCGESPFTADLPSSPTCVPKGCPSSREDTPLSTYFPSVEDMLAETSRPSVTAKEPGTVSSFSKLLSESIHDLQERFQFSSMQIGVPVLNTKSLTHPGNAQIITSKIAGQLIDLVSEPDLAESLEEVQTPKGKRKRGY
jgi:hypothetical protein